MSNNDKRIEFLISFNNYIYLIIFIVNSFSLCFIAVIILFLSYIFIIQIILIFLILILILILILLLEFVIRSLITLLFKF